jgi:hypothetical protein
MFQRNEFFRVFIGFISVFVLHMIGVFLIYIIGAIVQYLGLEAINPILSQIGLFAVLGIGITQLIYLVPYCFFLNHKNRDAEIKGVIIGAIITFLLNGGCWLIVASGMYKLL